MLHLDVDDGDCREGGFVHAGRRWEIGITWPGSSFGCSSLVLLDGVCRATVEDHYVPTSEGLRPVVPRGVLPLRVGVSP